MFTRMVRAIRASTRAVMTRVIRPLPSPLWYGPLPRRDGPCPQPRVLPRSLSPSPNSTSQSGIESPHQYLHFYCTTLSGGHNQLQRVATTPRPAPPRLYRCGPLHAGRPAFQAQSGALENGAVLPSRPLVHFQYDTAGIERVVWHSLRLSAKNTGAIFTRTSFR